MQNEDFCGQAEETERRFRNVFLLLKADPF